MRQAKLWLRDVGLKRGQLVWWVSLVPELFEGRVIGANKGGRFTGYKHLRVIIEINEARRRLHVRPADLHRSRAAAARAHAAALASLENDDFPF